MIPLGGGRRDDWLSAFAAELYGPIPAPPRELRITQFALPDRSATRLHLNIDEFAVDAALWQPPEPRGVIVCLDFVGPIGTLGSRAFPIDPRAVVALPAWRGGGHGPLDESLRGASMARVPVDLILEAGWAILSSCYGSWVPDDPAQWLDHGLAHRLGAGTRAISLWAWAIERLVDIAVELGHSRIAAAGHSRLGKAALWAAANDTRIAAVLSNDSGCAGASLSAHAAGETLADLRARFPHWVLPERALSVDQHQLLAAIAPRALYVASAANDDWADPVGEYLALQSAAAAWGLVLPQPDLQPRNGFTHGALGWHLRPGGHELLPYDWRRFLCFLNGLD